jgi:hypothetical protein
MSVAATLLESLEVVAEALVAVPVLAAMAIEARSFGEAFR